MANLGFQLSKIIISNLTVEGKNGSLTLLTFYFPEDDRFWLGEVVSRRMEELKRENLHV